MSEVRSFARTESVQVRRHEPASYGHLLGLLRSDKARSIRGAGLSYCLASAADGVDCISTGAFNRVLEFDRERRLIRVEPGLAIGDLVSVVCASGLWFPVLPGYPSITIGGCVAMNVHGKTQHNVGNFAEHVESLVLLHPDHGELHCSTTSHADLFDLTLGGFGLTGYIAEVTLRLQPLAGTAVRRVAHRVRSLDDAVATMDDLATKTDALYSWNDFNRPGASFGAGLVYAEYFVDGEEPEPEPARSMPTLPGWLPRRSAYSAVTMPLINRVYEVRDRLRPTRIGGVVQTAFPIAGNEIYFHLYGGRGFYEYQWIVPRPSLAVAIARLREAVAATRATITLGSLKLFAGSQSLLRFDGDGVCITLDAVDHPATAALFARLDRLVIEHGGVVNIAKDSRLSADVVARVFPEYRDFRSRLRDFDPHRRFDTSLRRRIDV
ncbi:MAG: FAD-binding oxidoreductase [Acidimicrobiales bacterium]|nr:FAD-binding oxidoreductase [Acidimicrobiales bacterium]